MKFLNKKINGKLLTISGIATVLCPVTLSISCTTTLESKLESLISDPNIIKLIINENLIRNELNMDYTEKLTIEDLFIANVETIGVAESGKLVEWNTSLNEEDKKSFSVVPRIKWIVLPEMPSGQNDKIDELTIFVDVSAGHLSDKVIEKKIKIDWLNNTISPNNNNYFNWTQNDSVLLDGPQRNNIYRIIKSNVLQILRSKNINVDISDDATTLQNKLGIKLSNDDSSNSNLKVYQDNLYCSFDSKDENSGIIYVNIYTNNEKIEEVDTIIRDKIAMKISFTINELNNLVKSGEK
ncbi:MAG: hypothetical protein HDR43_01950 [Mycoplasma sp.]|nr:hypothetical protein [Mycoplasma sp.]